MYEDRDARAPASMHSEKGSRNTVKGTMAKRSFVHLAMIRPPEVKECSRVSEKI